jgi:hypothetical protein
VNEAFADAARRQLVFAASGNGAGGFFGFVPHNTYQLSTAAPGVIVVGAHDNGRMTHWSGSPPTVVADGYGGWMAAHDDLTRYEPHPVACCTSASAPYAAGGAADLILQARTILGSRQVGSSGGVLASGTPTASGPLADGVLTLEEAHALLRHTAEARPAEGRDDGLVNWTGDPRAPDRLEHGPGGNPYCNGCQTLPVSWTDVPEDAPAYALVGYGAINDRTSALVAAVLRGELEEPARPQEDALYETDQNVRRTTR